MLLGVPLFLPLQSHKLRLKLVDLGVERVDLGGQLGDLVGQVPVRGLEDLVQALDLELQPLPLLVAVSIGLLEVGDARNGVLKSGLRVLQLPAELVLRVAAARQQVL